MNTAIPQAVNLPPGSPQVLRIVSLVIKFIAAFPLLVGAGLLAGAMYSAGSRYTVAKKWPAVDAQVTKSALSHHLEEIRSSKGNTRTATVYETQIEFRYAVAGRQYTTPTHSDHASSNYASMKQQVDVFAPGTRHTLRYNPANPNDIRYDAAFSVSYFFLPIVTGGIGLVFFLFGASLIGVGRRVGTVRVRCPSCGQMVAAAELACPLCGGTLAGGTFPQLLSGS